jgi:hypothetical protein
MMSWQENQAFIRRNASLGDEWYLFGIIATCVVCSWRQTMPKYVIRSQRNRGIVEWYLFGRFNYCDTCSRLFYVEEDYYQTIWCGC